MDAQESLKQAHDLLVPIQPVRCDNRSVYVLDSDAMVRLLKLLNGAALSMTDAVVGTISQDELIENAP